jgi:hypothetical protein
MRWLSIQTAAVHDPSNAWRGRGIAIVIGPVRLQFTLLLHRGPEVRR